jgi:O-antigen biosynthesis protein WbqP
MSLYVLIKRLFDIVASIAGIIILSPIWIIAMIGIELSDWGPLFYVAKRVGKDSKVFNMFKFRSMRIDRNADEKKFKAETSRIFWFGNIMRKLKIDELPQLLNVVIGDMSVVGPRPASTDQVQVMHAGKFAEVATVRPGLTGSAALYDYIYGDTIEDEQEYEKLVLPTRMKLELEYVRNRSLFYDMQLILWTIYCIIMTFLGRNPKNLLTTLQEKSESI